VSSVGIEQKKSESKRVGLLTYSKQDGEFLKKTVNERMRAAIAVFAAVCLAFALRVLPAWPAVFTPRGISFQEPDAWFHMRTIHNLVAHFPWSSGFDPYALYPYGKYAVGNLAFAPFWDYLVGSVAWVSGAGSPLEKLVDETGAWLPAVIGALFPIPVFFVARRLFGDWAGMLSAFWVAMIPGTFLWVSHLGMPDHHAVESMTSFLALSFLCAAVEQEGKWRWWSAGLAGIALGAYLDTRAAGIFVPAILAVTAFFAPALAPGVLITLGVACLGFTAGSGSIWSHYTWLALIGGMAVAAAPALLQRAARERNWSLRMTYAVTGGVAVTTIGCLVLFERARIVGGIAQISRFLPWHSGTTLVDEIAELAPLWRAAPGGFRSFFFQFGAAWILAAAGLAGVIRMARRRRRPALTLFLVWSVTMIIGVLFQLRMAAYAGIVVAILAGVASAWIVERIPAHLPWLRGVAAAILIMLGMVTTVPAGVRQIRPSGGPNPDWRAAMEWLRANTPEPMGEASAWYRWWPAVRPGQTFIYPRSAYSVIALWDKGSWITAIARRIPAANGAGDSGPETARFLTETLPEEAVREVGRTGARYAAIGPETVTVSLPALVRSAERRVDQYSRVFHVMRDDGRDISLRVYLPAFYRSMGARLYLFDGRRALSDGAQVFVTEMTRMPNGTDLERFLDVHSFGSEKEAAAWMTGHSSLRMTLASADPTRSCVDTEDLPWATRVFVSRAERIVGNRQPGVVKVFALTP